MGKVQEVSNGITEGVIWKQILIFFFPIFFGTLFMTLYNTVDAVIVGQFLGKEALAAVSGGTSTLTNLIIGFFNVFLFVLVGDGVVGSRQCQDFRVRGHLRGRAEACGADGEGKSNIEDFFHESRNGEEGVFGLVGRGGNGEALRESEDGDLSSPHVRT